MLRRNTCDRVKSCCAQIKSMVARTVSTKCVPSTSNRKQKRFAKIPEQLDDTKGKLEDRMRNLRRYISKAERVMLNVASGQFPGKY